MKVLKQITSVLAIKKSKKIEGDLVAFAPSSREGGNALIVIIDKNHDNFQRCKAGELWEVQYVNKAGQSFAIGYPMKKSEIEFKLAEDENKLGLLLMAGEERLMFIPFTTNRVYSNFTERTLIFHLNRRKLGSYLKAVRFEYKDLMKWVSEQEDLASDIVTDAMTYLSNCTNQVTSTEEGVTLTFDAIEDQLWQQVDIQNLPDAADLADTVRQSLNIVAYNKEKEVYTVMPEKVDAAAEAINA